MESKIIRCTLVTDATDIQTLSTNETPRVFVLRAKPRTLGARHTTTRDSASNRFELPEGTQLYPAVIAWLKNKFVPYLNTQFAKGFRFELDLQDAKDDTAQALRDCWPYWGQQKAEKTALKINSSQEKTIENEEQNQQPQETKIEEAKRKGPTTRSLDVLLRELEKQARLHGEGGIHRDLLKQLRAHPDASQTIETQITDKISRGQRQTQWLDQLRTFARYHGENHTKVVELLNLFEADFPYLKELAIRQIKRGASVRAQEYSEARLVANHEALSLVKPSEHDHIITSLPASSAWSLYITEMSGKNLSDWFVDRSLRGTRVVGLLIPEASALPALPSGLTESIEWDDSSQEQYLQAVLNAPVGILGMTTEDMYATRNHQWATHLIDFVQWVVRLLPIENATQLTISIEAREERNAHIEWSNALQQMMKGRVDQAPRRYRNLSIKGHIVGRDFDGFGLYLQSVAHMWVDPSRRAKTRSRQSGLIGACLQRIEGNSHLRELWDSTLTGEKLNTEEWLRLMRQPEAFVKGSIAHSLLEQIAKSCRNEPNLWRRYVEAARNHLALTLAQAKGFRLSSLHSELDWLQQAQPEKGESSKSFQFVQALAQLNPKPSELNISLQEQARVEFNALGKELFDENATLVCHADLEQASAHMHRYEWATAKSFLNKWSDVSPAIPGLKHWARVQLMLGQLAAIENRFDEADSYLTRAFESFSRLSDAEAVMIETKHTRSLRAIAAMDNVKLDELTRTERVSAVVSLENDKIVELASNDTFSRRYEHHLLLRYLVSYGSADQKKAYLSARPKWRTGRIRPWAMIELYRALLLAHDDATGACDHVMVAWLQTLDSEFDTLTHLINTTIGVIGRSMGADCIVSASDLQKLRSALPHAQSRIDALAHALEQPRPALELLAEVLPFSFR